MALVRRISGGDVLEIRGEVRIHFGEWARANVKIERVTADTEINHQNNNGVFPVPILDENLEPGELQLIFPDGRLYRLKLDN